MGPQFQSKKSSALHDHIDSSAELQQDHGGFMSLFLPLLSDHSVNVCLKGKDNKGRFSSVDSHVHTSAAAVSHFFDFLRGFRDSSTN